MKKAKLSTRRPRSTRQRRGQPSLNGGAQCNEEREEEAVEEEKDLIKQEQTASPSPPPSPGLLTIEHVNASSMPSQFADEENHPTSTSTASEQKPNNDERATASAAVHLTRSETLHLTEMLLAGADDDDMDDAISTKNSSTANVGGYKVRVEIAPLAKQIFTRYGDIVKESIFKSVEYRSSVLETVCNICQRLRSTKFPDLTCQELQSMLNVVNDLEPVKVDVGWLLCRLNEIFEAKEFKKGFPSLVESRTKTLQGIEELKKTWAETREEYEACMARCQMLQERLKKLEDGVGTAQVQMEEINASYSDTKDKLRCFYTRSLLHGIL
ncbi:unnamed protein product [Cuscuta epithymum]|uniref:Uncharacterized protein n=1 Tax=Cuscuta epithymum TaxID=186058 RepID=A0AAV0GGK3_9ASTE|nr:unnamed protein product [Cuscuta epithymum]CAH9147062.1 unnamed protein product [Cuscuta epithymum]